MSRARERLDEALAALPADAVDDVAAAVEEARARQLEALAASLDTALRIAPRPLRGMLRKVLVG